MPIFDPCVAINSSRSNAALQSYLLQATRMVAQVRHVIGRTPVWSANHDHPLQAWTGHACQRAPVDVTTTVIRLPRVLAASTNRLAISGRLASSKVTILAAGPIANSGMTPLAERRRCSALSRKAWFAHRTSFSPRRAHAWAVPLRRWTGRQRKAWARLEETPNPPRSLAGSSLRFTSDSSHPPHREAFSYRLLTVRAPQWRVGQRRQEESRPFAPHRRRGFFSFGLRANR